MKLRDLTALCLILVGCSGSTTDGGNSTGSELEKKRAAADAAASGQGSGDVCAENEWYGDGVCDSFCADFDTDCYPNGDPVVCAEFIETADGACSRSSSDPCSFQDPDCTQVSPGDPDDDDWACALIEEAPDRICSRPEDDPCRFQDPDCSSGGGTGGSTGSGGSAGSGGGSAGGSPGGYNCDLSMIACDSVEPTCPDGQVPTANDSCYGPCVPEAECSDSGVACLAYIEQPNGLCERAEDDPCRSQDPDCADVDEPVFCAEYIEEPNGVCQRKDDDPCIFQDPDCAK